MRKAVRIFAIISTIMLTVFLVSGCIQGDYNSPGSTERSDTTNNADSTDNTDNTNNTSDKEGTDDSEVAGNTTPAPFVLDDDLALGDLKVNMTRQMIEKVMDAGLSDSSEEDRYGMKSEYLDYNDGTKIHLVDGKIYSIEVSSSDYPTPRGLKVGDSASEIEILYGKPDDITEDGIWIYSPEGYDVFFVTVKDEIVKAIKVSLVL